MQQRYEQQMKKGVLEMLVLKQLEQEEKYGYQLISQLRDKSSEMFTLKEGTLYPRSLIHISEPTRRRGM